MTNYWKTKVPERSVGSPAIPKHGKLVPGNIDPVNQISKIEVANLAYLAAHGPITPLSYKEAICSPDSREWHQAMSEEIGNLTWRNTWELVPLPKGQKLALDGPT